MVLVKTKISKKRIRQSVLDALDLLRVDGTQLYKAAYPGYPGNFTRDSLIYCMLADDHKAMRAQIEFSAKNQGVKADPISGEEPGKIHHELPAVMINNRSSAYNACDTTALFLLAIAYLYKAGHKDVLELYSKNIQDGLGYIKAHVHNNLFYDDPSYCGASEFALHVTYWKDSQMNADNSGARYPIVYSLAHFQNADAIGAIGQILHQQELLDTSKRMTDKGIEKLWFDDHFVVAIDGYNNHIDPVSSDSLHSLLYINPDYIPDGYAEKIQNYMNKLETKAGYLTGIASIKVIDEYHTRYIWTHEQALLHAASIKHGLDKSAQVAARVIGFIDNYPELIDPVDNFKPAGNQPQLWAVGASQYFDNLSKIGLLRRIFTPLSSTKITAEASAPDKSPPSI